MGSGPSASGELFWVQTNGETTWVKNTSSGDLILRTSRFIDDKFERDLRVDKLVDGRTMEGEAYTDVVDDGKNASQTISYKIEARKFDDHAIRETITIKYKVDEKYYGYRAPVMTCEKGASGAPSKCPQPGFHEFISDMKVELFLKTLIEVKGGAAGFHEVKEEIETGYHSSTKFSQEMKTKLSTIPIPQIGGADMEMKISAELQNERHELAKKTLVWNVDFSQPCYIYQASIHALKDGEEDKDKVIYALEYTIQSPTPLPARIACDGSYLEQLA